MAKTNEVPAFIQFTPSGGKQRTKKGTKKENFDYNKFI